jgi:N utilization substance protein B
VSKEARVTALEILYAADARGELPSLEGVGARARRLVSGVWRHVEELDAELSSASRGWRVERMPAVDRNVLRLALYELRHTATPTAVVISEAVELAKTYSTNRSGAFVNGVLGHLAEEAGDPGGR